MWFNKITEYHEKEESLGGTGIEFSNDEKLILKKAYCRMPVDKYGSLVQEQITDGIKHIINTVYP